MLWVQGFMVLVGTVHGIALDLVPARVPVYLELELLLWV